MVARILGIGFLWLAGIAIIGGIAGCGEAGVDGVVPVTGKVTYKDQPVADATVSFIGEGQGGRTAVGTTAADGTYVLRTLNSEGAVPGKYTVTVTKAEAAAASGATVSMEDATKSVAAGEPKQLLPAKYADPTQSPLKFDVTADTKTIDLKLED